MEAVNGVSEGDKGAPPPPSPLTGCYLLIVVGEPHSADHKEIILQKVAKGLLSWDLSDCLVDLEKELAIITEQGLEGEEARYGERLIQFASENLVTEILIHPVVSTLAQCVRNLLSSFTRHRHIIHAGYTFANNGSWALQDGTFSSADFSEAFQELEVLRVIRAYENGISLDIHCSPEGDWTRLPKEPFTKSCKVRVNPTDVLTAGSASISNFVGYLEPFLIPAELEAILESSDVVGNIRFSRPTLYVFPGGQGDAALFGINGFNMLLDGGFSRKACFWDFVRHLDRLDAVLLTRLNNSNVSGISAVLRRKKQNALYPQIGHFFCNIQERKAILSPDGDKDKDPLLVNLMEEGQEIVSNLRHLGLSPQVCYRDSEPINLYHKVGHGTLDMYVLSPAKDSREVREFLQKWNNNDQKLFANQIKSSRDFVFPLQNLVSICALLVWQPANPEDTITRILFPGSTPQNKIFEGLDRLKSLDFIKHPVCSEKSLAPIVKIRLPKESFLDKIGPIEKKIPFDNKKTPKQPEKPDSNVSNNENEVKNGGEVNGDSKIVKKSDSVESDKSITKMATKKIVENGDKAKPKPKPKIRSDSQQRKVKTVEKKPSPPTPKKTLDKTNDDNKEIKPKPKASPTATPAKSAKDANNRKVLESKVKAVPKKEVQKAPVEKKEPKPERKPISRRPKDTKIAASPSKKVNGIQKPDSISRRGKLDKEGTTDSSTVSTPSADQETLLKKDISKLTSEELQSMKAQELADLKEEQEAVKEIEAVFRKGELHHGNKSSDFRKIKDLSIDDKLESEEYLIIEKTEIEQEAASDKDVKEDETQKHTRDSEESEKQRKLSGELKKEEEKSDEAEGEKRQDIQEVQKIITSAADIVKAKDEAVEMSKEVSATSPEDKVDVSTDKKTTDKDNEDEIKEPAPESQPDEKGSGNAESGATTTAPTLPEDERIPLDEIKEDNNGDQPIEEKHVKEDTKEKDIPVIQLPPKTFETTSTTKIPPVVGIRLDKQSHIRDIVKTPDEVADLPVHEEVDIDHYAGFPAEPKKVESEKSSPDDDDKKKKDDEKKKDDDEPKPADDEGGEVIGLLKEEQKPEPAAVETKDEVIKDEPKLDLKKPTTDINKEEKKEDGREDLNLKEISKSPEEEKDTDEHELQEHQEEVKQTTKEEAVNEIEVQLHADTQKIEPKPEEKVEPKPIKSETLLHEEKKDEKDDYKQIDDFQKEEYLPSKSVVGAGIGMEKDSEQLTGTNQIEEAKQFQSVKENISGLEKIDEKLQKLKEQTETHRRQSIGVVQIDHKTETPEHAESVVLAADSAPESPEVEDKLHIDDKLELGRKSPKEREEDVIKIVASVAEVLKSDAPLEEFEGKIPFSAVPYKSYTTELRETHITTVDSPITDEKKSVAAPESEFCPKSMTSSFLEQERKIPPVHEEPEKEEQESKISKMMKDSNELMQATSKIISDIKLAQPIEESSEEGKDEEIGTVHRMLVTASSEDGGEETEICPPGTIVFSRSSESSGRSSPDILSQKQSQRSSAAETLSEQTQLARTMREVHSGKDSGIDEDPKEVDSDVKSPAQVQSEVEKQIECVKPNESAGKSTTEKVTSEGKDAKEKSETILEKVVDETKEVSKSILDSFCETTAHVADLSKEKKELIEKDVELVEKDVKQTAEEIKSEVKDKVDTGITYVQEKVGQAEEALSDMKIEAVGGAKTVIEEGKQKAAEKLGQVKAMEEHIVKTTVAAAETVPGKIEGAMVDEVKASGADLKAITEKVEDVKSVMVENVEAVKDNLSHKVDELKDLSKRVEEMTEKHSHILEKIVDTQHLIEKDGKAESESGKSSPTKYSLFNGLEEIGDMVVDVITADRESSPVKEKEEKSVLKKIEQEVDEIVEKGVEEVNELVEETKGVLASVLRRESKQEEVLEKAAHDIEENYQSVSDMSKSIVFEKCDKPVEQRRAEEKEFLEESARDIAENFNLVSDMAKSVVFEKCDTASAENETKPPTKLDEKDEANVLDAIEDEIVKEQAPGFVSEMPKKEPEEKKDEVADKKSPEPPKVEKRESIVEKVEDSVEKFIEHEVEEVKEFVQHTKEAITSMFGIHSKTEETKEEQMEHRRESIVSEKIEQRKESLETEKLLSGKTSPEPKISGKSTPKSGKSSPDLRDSLLSGPDSKIPSRISTPDLKDSTQASPMPLRKELQDYDSFSGKSTPDRFTSGHLISETKDSLLSGKSTPHDLISDIDKSGASTPEIVEIAKTSASVQRKYSIVSSGKATPDLNKEAERRESIVASGKTSPELQEVDRKESITSPGLETQRKDSIVSPGKGTHEDRKASIPSGITSVPSGKATPDVEETVLETERRKSIVASGKATPEIKESQRKESITSVEASRRDSIISSGKATPDIKDSHLDERKDSVPLVSSGKATPDVKETILDTERRESIVSSGKATPEIKESERKESITGVEALRRDSIIASGKATPDIKDSHLDERKESIASGKASPALPTPITSGKATPDIKENTVEAERRESIITASGKATPELGDLSRKNSVLESHLEERNNSIASGKVSPILPPPVLSGKVTPELQDVSRKDSITSSGSVLNADRKDSIISSDIKESHLEERKDSIASVKEPILETERRESVVASGKSTPEIQTGERKYSITSSPGLETQRKESIVSSGKTSPLPPAISPGKVSPNLEESGRRESIVASGKATPDLGTERKDSLISGKSGKTSPDHGLIPERKDSVMSGKSSPGFIEEAKSGKSTPDVKDERRESLLSGKASPLVPGETKESGKSTPEPSKGASKDPSGKSSPRLDKDKDEDEGIIDKIEEEIEEVVEKGVEEVKDIIESAKKAITSIFAGSEIEKEEKALEESAKDIEESFKEVDLMSKSVIFEKCETDAKVIDPGELKEAEETLEKSAKDIEDNFQTVTDMSKSMVFEKCESPEAKELEKAAEILDKSAKDIEENFQKVSDMSKSIVFERCESVDHKELEKASDILEKSADDLEKNYEAMCDMSKSIIFEKCDLEGEEKKDTATKDKETPFLEVIPSSEKKLSVSDVEITFKEEPEKTKERLETKDSDSLDSGIGPDQKKSTDSSEPIKEKLEIKESLAGPSTKDSSLSPAKSSTEDLSGKSTPDIAEVEKIKEQQETLKHEKHIPGSSTPPTVPVSPIIKEASGKKPEAPSVLTSLMKDAELRSATPGSDDFPISTQSEVSSRISHFPEGERIIDSDEDEEIPGSPMSVTSQVAHSRSSSHYDFDDDRIGTKMDPMNTSFYGVLPDEEGDFEKAMLEHREARGEDLVPSASSSSYLYEITKAKFEGQGPGPSEGGSELDQINKNGQKSDDLMSASFYGTELPTSGKKDAIDTWGKPLGLPSPAPPNDNNKGTPKKERRVPASVTAKNKLNDDKKRAESPSKYNKNRKINPVYVDLTYVPHHGNAYYSYVDFFRRVRARYYVFSGIEPSKEVYNALLEAKQTWEDKELEVTIIPTYDTDILGYWVAENEELLTKYKIDLSPSASRCTINLQDHETSCSAYRLEF